MSTLALDAVQNDAEQHFTFASRKLKNHVSRAFRESLANQCQ